VCVCVCVCVCVRARARALILLLKARFCYVCGDHASARRPYEMVTLKIGCVL